MDQKTPTFWILPWIRPMRPKFMMKFAGVSVCHRFLPPWWDSVWISLRSVLIFASCKWFHGFGPIQWAGAWERCSSHRLGLRVCEQNTHVVAFFDSDYTSTFIILAILSSSHGKSGHNWTIWMLLDSLKIWTISHKSSQHFPSYDASQGSLGESMQGQKYCHYL